MASDDRICPPIMNPVMGKVVIITDRLGFLMPFFKAGMRRFIHGNCEDSQLRNKHHDDTKANCNMVSVTGLGNARRICFDEVLDMTEAKYHIEKRAYITH